MIKSVLKKLFLAQYYLRQKSYTPRTLKKIALLYYVPKDNKEKYTNWEDGFTKGIDFLSEDYEMTRFNLEDRHPTASELNQYDFIISKSCWGWVVDNYIRSLKSLTVPRGILVSCSKLPMRSRWMYFYDVIWFETFWYGNQLKGHPCKIHAFGINVSDFQPVNVEKDIDVLSIGALTAYKRLHKICDLEGENKVVIGDTHCKDSASVEEKLRNNGVEVVDYVPQKRLADYINRSKLVYIPTKIQGGGERAVLEARRCQIPVKVEEDNLKLQELRESPIWDQWYYSSQIRKGIEKFDVQYQIDGGLEEIDSNEKMKVGRNSFHMGSFRYLGDRVVSIGSFCKFGQNVTILALGDDAQKKLRDKNWLNMENKRRVLELADMTLFQNCPSGTIEIGSDVVIGNQVVILPCVSIGHGAVIPDNVIVNRNIEPFEIFNEDIESEKRYRYSKEVIKKLLTIKWWYWSDTTISKNSNLFEIELNENIQILNDLLDGR